MGQQKDALNAGSMTGSFPAVGDRLNDDEGIPAAETRAALAARVYAATEAITASPTEHQVIVTHGFTLTFVIAAWIQMPPSRWAWMQSSAFYIRSGAAIPRCVRPCASTRAVRPASASRLSRIPLSAARTGSFS